MRKLQWIRTPIFSTVLAALLVTAFAAPPRTAHAQTQPTDTANDDGRSHFNTAVVLFREGDFRGALVEFRRAHDLSHNYRALYNVAQTEYELQDYAAALRSFERYLIDGGADIDPDRRNSVKLEIKRLTARVAKLDVKSNVVGADVLVDDIVVGHTPLTEPLLVSAGRRRIGVQKTDYAPTVQVLDLAGGDVSSVTLDLTATSSARALPAATQAAPASPSRAPFWFSLAATSALTAGAVVTGVLAIGAHSDANTALQTRGISAYDVTSAHNKAANFALVTDIVGGAALAMAAVTVVLFVTSTPASAERTGKAELAAGPGGAVLRGVF